MSGKKQEQVVRKRPVRYASFGSPELFVLLGICLLLYFWQLGDILILDEDAALYLRTAREILLSGDWFTLRFNGIAWFDKPPLTIWLMALSIRTWGMNEWAWRLWHVFFGVGTVVTTYLLGRELFNRHAGLVCAVVLATSVQFFYQVRSPLQDVPLTFFVALALLQFVLFLRRGRVGFAYGFWAAIGLAVLTKGVVGLVLPVLCAGAYLIVSGQMSKITRRMWLHVGLGIGIFLAIALPWHVIEYLRHGSRFLDEYFITRTLNRYLYPDLGVGDPQSVAGPKWVYVPEIFALFFPWSGFLILSLVVGFRGLAHRQKSVVFPLTWFLVIFVFFSLSSGRKFVRYLLPLFPGLALMVGYVWHTYLRGQSRRLTDKGMWWSAVFLLAVGSLLFVAAVLLVGQGWLPDEYRPYVSLLLPAIGALAAGAVIGALLLFVDFRRPAFAALAGGSLFCFGLLIFLAPGRVGDILVTKKLVSEARPLLASCESVAAYRYPKFNSFILYADRYVVRVDEAQELAELLEKKQVCCVSLLSHLAEAATELRQQGRELDYRIVAREAGAVIIDNQNREQQELCGLGPAFD